MKGAVLRFNSLWVVVVLLLSSVLPGSLAAQTKSSSLSTKAGHETIRLRDTLRTEAQRSQFRQAVKMAPSTFVCDSFKSDGKSSASCTKLRFNDSMRRVLQVEFVRKDAFLHKQMRRLYLMTRPFNITGDLSVRYKTLPDGSLAVQYDISELYIWNHRASDRLIREVLKANGVTR